MIIEEVELSRQVLGGEASTQIEFVIPPDCRNIFYSYRVEGVSDALINRLRFRQRIIDSVKSWIYTIVSSNIFSDSVAGSGASGTVQRWGLNLLVWEIQPDVDDVDFHLYLQFMDSYNDDRRHNVVKLR